MYLVGFDSEGSGALRRRGWTHGQRSSESSWLHRQAMKASKKGKYTKQL